MVDRERVLSKFSEMDLYLDELKILDIGSFEDYLRSVEKRRALERLMQILVESVMDVCNIIYSELRVGMPFDEGEVFLKLKEKGFVSEEVEDILIGMKGFRNVIVHKYGKVSDRIVYDMYKNKMKDFGRFRKEIMKKVG